MRFLDDQLSSTLGARELSQLEARRAASCALSPIGWRLGWRLPVYQ
jgi:hypothetical protein